MANARLRNQFRNRLEGREPNWPSWEGRLGDAEGNVQVYEDDGTIRANFVHVRRDGKESGLCQVYNDAVPLKYDMAVRVGKGKNHPRQWRVLGTAGANPAGVNVVVNEIAAHGDLHRWRSTDPVYVDIRAITNLGVYVTDPESKLITVFRGYVWTGTAYVAVAYQTVDLTAHIPSTAGKAALVLVSIASDGSIATTKGSEVDLADLGIDDVPSAPAGTLMRLAAVRVYEGQTVVLEDDIVDLRFANEGEGAAASGDVNGPATNTDNAIARWDGTDSKTLQNSLATVDDTGTINIPTGQTYNINGAAHRHTTSDIVGNIMFDPMTEPGDMIYRPDELTLANENTSGVLTLVTPSTVETIIPDGALTIPSPTGPVVVAYDIYASLNAYNVTKYLTLRIRRDNASGEVLWSSQIQVWADTNNGHDGHWSGTHTDNSPNSGSYVLTLQGNVNGGLYCDTRIYSITGPTENAYRLPIGDESDVLTVSGGFPAWQPPSTATDADAIHVDEAGEIAGLTEKTDLADTDLIVIEDSEDTNAKKKVQIGNLPGGEGGGHVLQDNGTEMPAEPNLNFIGCTVTDDPDNDATIVDVGGLPVSVTKENVTIDGTVHTFVTDVQNAGGEIIYGKKLLYDLTLSADGTFDVSNLPQTYDHLELVLIARGARADISDNLKIYFNNDTTGTNYRNIFLCMDTTNASRLAYNETVIGVIPSANGPAGAKGVIHGFIPTYSATTLNKHFQYNSSGNSGATQYLNMNDGDLEWQNTAAISRISIQGYTTTNLLAGSRLQIFGHKNMTTGSGVTSGYIGTQLFRQVVPAGGVANFDITAIPTGYDRIEIHVSGKTNRAAIQDPVLLSLNGDTTNGNYISIKAYQGDASGGFVAASREVGDLGASDTATIFGQFDLVLTNLDNGTWYKSITGMGTIRTSGGNRYVKELALEWANISAVNRITLTPSVGTLFAEGTLCTVVGYKNQLIGGDSGWKDADAMAYASADDPTYTMTCTGDLTGRYSSGMRIQLTQATGGLKYFIITKVAYSAPNTTLTLYGGTDYNLENEAVTGVYFSTEKAPYGFPLDPTKWMVKTTDTSDQTQSSPGNSTWYNPGSITITIPIGAWEVDYEVFAYREPSSAGWCNLWTTLSTANNSESDKELSAISKITSDAATSMMFKRAKTLVLTSKTAYYLNTKTDTGSGSIVFFNSLATCVVRARCVYL